MLARQMLEVAAHRRGASTASYQSVVLADSPIAYWPLDETSGTTAYDITSSPNNASIASGMTLGASAIGANTGTSYSGTGVSNVYCTVSATKIPSSGPISIEEWFYNAGGKYTNGFVDNPNYGFRHQYQPSGGISVIYNNAAQSSISATDAPTGTPLHVVTTYDGSTVRTYVNGVFKVSKVASLALSNSSVFLGASTSGGESLNGRMSNIAIYSTALTSTQILNHYNAGK